MGRTLFDRIWDTHVVAALADGRTLIHVDRHLIHELTSPQAFDRLREAGRPVRNPELNFAMQDHIIPTMAGRGDDSFPTAGPYVRAMRRNAQNNGIRLFDLGDERQGIVHVVAPELAIALPGMTVACGDSHTCTIGGLGALAVGVGTSDIEHILATQTLALNKPKQMRIAIASRLANGVTAKDLILHIIRTFGADAGVGHAVEFAGEAVTALPVEGRLTLCNMAVELGSRTGFVAPDEVTFAWLDGRAYSPKGSDWEAAIEHWRTLRSDEEAAFDSDLTLDAGDIAPQITWGTSPQHAIGIDEAIPDPAQLPPDDRDAASRALDYMGLQPGRRLEGCRIDKVFIGSCTNSRLSDLRAAAEVAKSRRVADGVRALVVPGSTGVKRAAEAEGLDRIFTGAGFEWRESGCSMCVGINGDTVGPGERCVSTANRNFEGRQGRDARTHLASPAMAAAAAVAGCIVDVRKLLN